LKRKFGNRGKWKRLIEREYAQEYIVSNDFTGYIALLKINKVTEPLFVQYGADKLCIVDDGYYWLQHFPKNKFYSVTTMFDTNGDVVQWYIDICSKNGINREGIPWMEDLFLDIIVLPSGRNILKDADELETAFAGKVIDEDAYNLAKREANRLIKLIDNKSFNLLKLSKPHKNLLLNKMKA
jgi:uncharacterized protein